MPLFEYECQDCRENFEKLVRIAGTQTVECPQCGSSNTVKKFSVFATKNVNSNAFSANTVSNCAPGGT